jgi:octanoyl-[GcvH]:protein N-octanoyltransferase
MRATPGGSRLRLLRESFPGAAALDTALSRALLERVAAGELGATLRLARPGAMLAFGKRDAVSRGYPAAVRAAREAGFEPVLRLAGGRAAVFHEGTIAVAHAVPDHDPRSGVHRRFAEAAELIAAALRRLGIDAAVGEVPGEYCPGGYSVNARGRVKLAGIGQRVIAGGAHLGGVVVASGADRVRDALVPVYRALGLDWDPATAGSAAEEAAVRVDEVLAAIKAEYASRYELERAALDEETLALARRLAPEHRAAAQRRST